MGIMMMAFASVMTHQTRSSRGLSEKLAAMDFQQQLTRSFSDGAVCTALLNGLTFDASNATSTAAEKPKITINQQSVPTSSLPGAPALAEIDTPVSPLAPTVVVVRPGGNPPPFQVTNIVGTSNGAVGSYTGFFNVNFDQTKLAHSLRPAQTQITLQTTSSGTTQTITGCGGGIKIQSGSSSYPTGWVGPLNWANTGTCTNPGEISSVDIGGGNVMLCFCGRRSGTLLRYCW